MLSRGDAQGFIPSAQALTRARWTYLIRTGRLGADNEAPSLKTVFSYEGIIDDIGFMAGPSASIALAAALFPTAGMLMGGACFVVGTAVLVLSRSTEPEPGWGATAASGSRRSVFVTSGVVRVLFALMFFLGAFYGVFDSGTLALAEELGNPSAASIVLIVSAAVSIVAGFVFGMMRLAVPVHVQLVGTALLVGCAYGTMVFIWSLESLFVVSTIASLFYAPFIITANTACERMVPSDRLTEAITWLNAGCICGLAFGPMVGGAFVDTWGATASFGFGAALAVAIPVVAIAFLPVLKRTRR